MTKFEKWCLENPLTAKVIGAARFVKKQQSKAQSYNQMLDLLNKIRYCKWPQIGLGIGLTPEEMDEILIIAEQRN